MLSGSGIARGGVYLVSRQVLGAGVSLLAMFFVTRTIGAGAFGSFAATLAIVGLVQTVCLFGLPVFLLRRTETPERSEYDIAFTLSLLLAAVVTIAGLVATAEFDRITGIPGVGLLGASMFLATPLVFATAIPAAALERSLDFRRVASIEVAAQLANVSLSIPLALTGAGVWAPIAGWWAAICVTAMLTFVFGCYRPRLRWDARRAGHMLAFGLRFSASAWLFQLRQLFNPLLIGPFLGAEAVGVFALTTRVVEALSFAKGIAWRMSLAVFGQLGAADGRVSAAVAKGALLQLVMLLPLLLGFSVVGPQLVSYILGRDWGALSLMFPPIAMAVVLNSLFTLQASALHVAGRSPMVALFSATQVVCLMIGGWVAIPMLGLAGVVVAEIAAAAAYPILHRAMVIVYGPSRMNLAYVFGVAGAIALFWQTLGGLAWIPLACVFVSPPFRRILRRELPRLLSMPRKTMAESPRTAAHPAQGSGVRRS